MNLFGVFNFNAPYLPFVLLGFPLLFGGSLPWHDIPGLVVGHVYYFLEDVYPRMPGSNGYRPLGTPRWFLVLFNQVGGDDIQLNIAADPAQAPAAAPQINEERLQQAESGWEDIAEEVKEDSDASGEPGGYQWGQGNRLGESGEPSGESTLRQRNVPQESQT